VTIDAPPERVWPWVADLGKHAAFSPKPYSVEWIEGEPNAVGSRYRSVGEIPMDKHHVNEGEIVENHPNGRFVLHAHDKDGDYPNTFTLKPVGSSTGGHDPPRIREHARDGRDAGSIVFPLVGKKDMRARMALLKQKVEAGRAVSVPPGSSRGVRCKVQSKGTKVDPKAVGASQPVDDVAPPLAAEGHLFPLRITDPFGHARETGAFSGRMSEIT
jgi:uncharacterized protein YndB with AHSA1/START domain